jgi:hypothetical protein
MDAVYGLCRLSISEWDADLSGPPDALDSLANELENAADDSAFPVVGGRVGVKRTGSWLRVSLDGSTLWIGGDQTARDIVLSAMRGVAQESREVGHAPVARHAHIEYLGSDDQWREPDSFPLVVGADGPNRPVTPRPDGGITARNAASPGIRVESLAPDLVLARAG